MSSAVRTARYVRTWLGDNADLAVEELVLERNGTPIPATLYRPRAGARPLPVWIVLHGMTRPGRRHLQLVRFARALAATRAAVLVPEVPEWVALTLAPHRTIPTIAAALDAVPDLPLEAAGRPALVGFSFGAPQAVAASGAAGVRGRLAGTVAFGGYADLERTIRFQLTGHHSDGTQDYWLRPDPYGRWIVAGNYLSRVPGLADGAEVASALLDLAREAGDRGVMSWDPTLDPLKQRLARRFSGPGRVLFDELVHGPDREQEPARTDALVASLTRAALAHDPAIDAAASMGGVEAPVHILHGRNDHLIPFTEADRLAAAVPDGVRVSTTITRLFGHSAQDPFPWLEGPRETVTFLRALASMLDLV